MANYYHEARAQVRKLKEIQESNQRRSERRAEVAGANVSLGTYPIDGALLACSRLPAAIPMAKSATLTAVSSTII